MQPWKTMLLVLKLCALCLRFVSSLYKLVPVKTKLNKIFLVCIKQVNMLVIYLSISVQLQ